MTEKKRRTTLTSADVARKAGVSRTAVSYVLNGVGSAHVSEENRAKILQAAQELGYHIHSSARALRKGHSDEVSIVADMPISVHRSELYLSLQQGILQRGYTPVFYYGPSFSGEQSQEFLLRILARRPMGLFATPLTITVEANALARKMGVNNIVLLSVVSVPYAPTIVFPLREVGELAAQHLLERGHRHLALVRPDDPLYSYSFEKRLEGMRSVVSSVSPDITLDILPMQYTLPAAHELVDSCLGAPDHPTGIYAFNDEYALMLLAALADRGIRVPQDIAVIGTDGIAFSELVRPALTTISFDDVSISQHIIDMLVDQRQDQPLSELRTHSLTPQLIVRGST